MSRSSHEPALAGFSYEPSSSLPGSATCWSSATTPRSRSVLRDLTGARVQMRKGGMAGIDGGELVVLMTPGEIGAIAESAEAAA